MKLQTMIDAAERRLPSWGYLAACGGIFLLVFYGIGYAGIPADYYHARDDGVITMSHARNLVEFGFVGVGPSGERVEGYSAPVQMFVVALAYLLTGAHYSAYADGQTLVCTFLLGLVAGAFFLRRKLLGMAASAALALALCYQTPFLLWHASGMENAITHVLFAATVYCLFRFAEKGRINYLAVPLVFLASISRVESIFHIFPLLAVFSAYWLVAHRAHAGGGSIHCRRVGAVAAVQPLALFLLRRMGS